MAQTADVVAVDIEARLDKASANRAAQDFDQTVDRMVASAGKAEQAVTQAGEQIGRNMEANAPRVQKLGTEVTQLARAMADGAAPAQALANHALDLGTAAGGAMRASGLLASVLTSGVVIAATLAASAIVSLVAKLSDEGDEVDDLVKKLEEKHRQTGLNEQADRIWAQTTEALTEAIRKRREEQEKALRTDIQAEEASRQAAQTDLSRAKNEITVLEGRENFQRQIVARRRREALAAQGVGGVEEQSAGLALLQSETALRQIGSALEDWRTALANAEAELRTSKIPIMMREVEGEFDKAKKAADDYTRALGDLNAEQQRTGMSDEDYRKRLREITAERKRALEALKAENAEKRRTPKAADNDLSTFLRPIAGGVVPSGGRLGDARPGRRHAGVDLATPLGTPVRAPEAGVVIESGTVGGYGQVVFIDHGRGTISRLAHLSSRSVEKGTRVERGQLIGESGQSGNATGPTLHYEVRQNGKAVDPFAAHPADAAGVRDNAAQLARERERLEQQRISQIERFNVEMERLEQQELATRGEVLHNSEERLDHAAALVKSEYDQRVASINQAVAGQRITETQGQLLIEKTGQVAAAQLARTYEEEGARRAEEARGLWEQWQQGQIDELEWELRNAKTARERHQIALRLLNAQFDLLVAEQRQIESNTQLDDVTRERARIAREQLERERGRATSDANRDPQNMSPGQRYREQIKQAADQIDESAEQITVDGLQRMEDELLSVITGAESLGEAFDNVADQIISALLRIAIQQAIIRPLADLLFGPGAGGGAPTGGGGWVGQLGTVIMSMFKPRASGGPVSANQSYMVGEDGVEAFVPSQSGTIIPNNQLAALAAGGGARTTVAIPITIHAPGATAETVAMIRREIRGAAPALIAASQRVTTKTLTRRSI